MFRLFFGESVGDAKIAAFSFPGNPGSSLPITLNSPFFAKRLRLVYDIAYWALGSITVFDGKNVSRAS